MQLVRVTLCIITAIAYICLRLLVSVVVKVPVCEIIYTLLCTSALMLVQLGFVTQVAGLRLRLGATLALVVVTMLLLVCTIGVESYLTSLKTVATSLVTWVGLLHDLFLILFATSLGYMVGFIVREPNIILPVALFAAAVDYWNVTWGMLSKTIRDNPEIVAKLSVTVPTPIGLTYTIGMGDFVFWALFFGVLYRFGMNTKATFVLGYALLTVSLILVLLVGCVFPALVPMGLAVVVANMRFFKLSREELLATLYVGGILLIFLSLSAFLFSRH
jgi:hypothetical protein